MGSFSDYAENACLEHVLTEAAYSPAATLYLALCTADPTDAGTGASMNEVANANGYARTAIAFGAASARRVTQSGAVTFPEASGSWGMVTHWAIVTSATHGAGNMLAHGAFGSSFAVVAGNTRTVPTTEIYVEFSASAGGVGFTNYTANGFLDRMFRNQAFTVAANYVALHTTTNSDSTPGTEVSGNNYSRVEINEAGGSSPAWTAAGSSNTTSNANTVTFPDPSGSWGTVVAMSVYDASSSGNQLMYGNDVVDQAVGAETTEISFPAGDIDVAVAA